MWLEKLVQHIYTLIGVAKTCYNMGELRDKMAEMYGKSPVQMTLYLPPPQYHCSYLLSVASLTIRTAAWLKSSRAFFP